MRATITIDTPDMKTSEVIEMVKALRQQLPATNIEAHDSDTGDAVSVPVERPTRSRWGAANEPDPRD